ncbi:MAG: hypothetical protein JNL38_37010 [Myxococcales bacterium]|jgi:hypothetical protein|nr:hypothetical protein [Myxococcales bacterium]
MRFAFVPSLSLGALIAGAVVLSCSGPDPGEIQYKERRPTSGQTSSGGSNSSSGDADGGSSGGSSSGDGGGSSGSLIFADAFTAGTAVQTASAIGGHNGKFGAAGSNPAGQDCTTCHKAGGTAPQLTMGGTAYADSAGTTPLQGAQVRVVDGTGKRLCQAYTDKDGNFYCTDPVTIAAGSKVGIRTATKVGEMQTPISTGNCATASCHGPLKIYPNK